MHFIKIKLPIIVSLLYKIGAHFGQYFENLSPKVGKDQKQKALHRKSELISGKPNRKMFGLVRFLAAYNKQISAVTTAFGRLAAY